MATVRACSSDILNIVLPHWNAMPHTLDMTPQPGPVTVHSTRGRPVAVLTIDLERHIGSDNYPFYCLRSDPTEKS